MLSIIQFRRLHQATVTVAAGLVCVAAMGANRGPITRLTVDPDAPVVELFEGMEQGQYDVRMVAQNAYDGRILITNKTDKPLTVAIPKGLVGVQVLPQFNLNQGMGLGNPFGGGGNLMGQNGQGQNGMAQAVGGNANPMQGNPGGFPSLPGGGGLNGQAPMQGFFSIPAEKTVQLGFSSVCLNYGRREPHAGMKYRLVKAEDATTDPMLQQLLESYSPRTSREVQQAAAWHLANGLTWEQISQLMDQQVPGSPIPLFNSQQLKSARELVAEVKKAAEQRP
ncbi:MAG: hypothetical protein JSS49_18495, partial [Planctomycetes bacterium]|nr:hypothetical protein [Planctomycetota bacterium]